MLSARLWLKWRILGLILPLTVLFSLAKWAVHQLAWEVWSANGLTSSLFGAATLIVAFILSGTLGDYRDSEGLPAQVSNAIEAIQDGNQVTALSHPQYDPQPLLRALIALLEKILDWLRHHREVGPVMGAIADLNQELALLNQHSEAPLISRVQSEQARLRLTVTRIQLIRDTTFVAPAYALLELFTLGVMVALLLIHGETFSETLAVSSLMFTAFAYLLVLIRDLDDPFEYHGNSSADVALTVLEQTLERLRGQLKPESGDRSDRALPPG